MKNLACKLQEDMAGVLFSLIKDTPNLAIEVDWEFFAVIKGYPFFENDCIKATAFSFCSKDDISEHFNTDENGAIILFEKSDFENLADGFEIGNCGIDVNMLGTVYSIPTNEDYIADRLVEFNDVDTIFKYGVKMKWTNAI